MRTLTFVALFAMAVLAIASQARAGSPCCCAAPCMAPGLVQSHVYQPYEVPPIYVVNQGPVYSGGWVYSRPQVVPPRVVGQYPYVAADYPGHYYGPVLQPLPRHRRTAIRARY